MTQDNSQWRFLAQHRVQNYVATFRNDVATMLSVILCCTKNHCCKSSRVTSPWKKFTKFYGGYICIWPNLLQKFEGAKGSCLWREGKSCGKKGVGTPYIMISNNNIPPPGSAPHLFNAVTQAKMSYTTVILCFLFCVYEFEKLVWRFLSYINSTNQTTQTETWV